MTDARTSPRRDSARRQTPDERPRRRKPFDWSQPFVYLLALIVAGIAIAPVVYVWVSGFRSTADLNADPAGWPNPWTVDNYVRVLTSERFWGNVFSSSLIGFGTTLGVIVLGVLAAFAIARYDFRGRNGLYGLFAAGLMFPVTVAALPLSIMLRNFDLHGTFLGLIIPQIGFALPTTIIILVPFLRAIPERARRGGGDRRGEPSRILLAHRAAALGSGTRDRRRARVRRQLERVPAAVAHPRGGRDAAGSLDAAARHPAVRGAVLGRHRCRARVHLARDASGDRVLHARRTTHRRRAHRRSEGLNHAMTLRQAQNDAVSTTDRPASGSPADAGREVDALIARMTLEQKTAQLVGAWVGASADGGDVAPRQHELTDDIDIDVVIPGGLGQITRPFGTVPVDPALGALSLLRLQQRLVAEGAHRLPAVAHEECLAGFAAWGATAYPVPLSWGASFDPESGRADGSPHRRRHGVGRHPSGSRARARRRA